MASLSHKTKDIKIHEGLVKSKKPSELCLQPEKDFLADFDDSVSLQTLFINLYTFWRYFSYILLLLNVSFDILFCETSMSRLDLYFAK